MMISKRFVFRILVISIVALQWSCKSGHRQMMTDVTPNTVINGNEGDIIAKLPGQFPEGLEFDKNRNLFFLSAINKNPSIASINFDGSASLFTDDGKLHSSSSFGLQIDYEKNRLLACTNNDQSGNLNIYNLETGELLYIVNLSSLLIEGSEYQANDLVVGLNNQIYVTGRLENTIYKVDEDLNPEIFLHEKSMTRPNGIVIHSNGYLIVSYTNDNSRLIKIPLNAPKSWTEVKIEEFDFIGFDGMILNEHDNLVAISKSMSDGLGIAVELTSKDDWKTASVKNYKKIKRSTTITQVGPNAYYAVNQDWKNREAEFWTLEYIKF